MILSDHVVILTMNNCVRNTWAISSDRAAGRLVFRGSTASTCFSDSYSFFETLFC